MICILCSQFCKERIVERGFVPVTRCARVGNLVFVRHRRSDESESMRVNHRIFRAFRFNRILVARNAPASGTAILVVGMFLDRRC